MYWGREIGLASPAAFYLLSSCVRCVATSRCWWKDRLHDNLSMPYCTKRSTA